MSDLTSTDLAVTLERMALRLRSEGDKALKTTREWADTIRAVSYDANKGDNRWEKDEETGAVVAPLGYSDPTGKQVVEPDEVAQLYSKLRRLMRQLRSAAADAEHILDQANHDPKRRPTRPDDPVDEDRWCTSCMQDRGRLEPVAVHPDGRVRFKDCCRWCHDFTADYGRRPTAELVRKHHTPYVNVTEDDINRAFGWTRSKAPA
jgi:hypothetical protein